MTHVPHWVGARVEEHLQTINSGIPAHPQLRVELQMIVIADRVHSRAFSDGQLCDFDVAVGQRGGSFDRPCDIARAPV